MLDCIVAEDEQLLRASLLAMLAAHADTLNVVAECEDGGAALEAIAEHKPDVAFLDIRMPGLTGLEVAAAAIEASPGTQVVFVTAYDQYAIDAFEQGAVDYLLKPVAADRLAATVQRLQARAAAGGADPAAFQALLRQLTTVLPTPPSTEPPLGWITASTGKETRLILVEDIAYFRAEHKYTTVVTAEGEALLRKPIRELLAVLDPALFRQVHRSTIVNLKAIASVMREDDGRGVIRLRNRPETLVVSAPFMALFRGM
ncbi:MAG: LytR/AlgR family response regulator transcription factor [Arenimonas sp.]